MLNCKRSIKSGDHVAAALGPTLDKSRKIKELPIASAHETIIEMMHKLHKKRFITLGTPSIKAIEDRFRIITVVPRVLGKLVFPTVYQETNRTIDESIFFKPTVVCIINPNVHYKNQAYGTSFGDKTGDMNVSKENVAKVLIDHQRCISNLLHVHVSVF